MFDIHALRKGMSTKATGTAGIKLYGLVMFQILLRIQGLSMNHKICHMKPTFLLYVLPLVFFLTACSPSIQVNTEPAPGFRLSDYNTFAFYEVDASGEGLSPAYRTQVQYIQQEIAEQLEARGLAYSASQPDLLINLGIVVTEEVQTRETDVISDPPLYVGQRRYTWRSREVEVGRYREGTVSVHLVDNSRNELVWRGRAEAILASKQAKLHEQIAQGVEEMFQEIPQ